MVRVNNYSEESHDKNFRVCENKGFYITFKNGWTVSVQFGPGNYCENYHEKFPLSVSEINDVYYISDDAEVWSFNKNGDNYPESPLSNQSPKDLLTFMNKVSKLEEKD